MANLIDGRSLARAIRNTLPARVKALPRTPGLGVVLVGNDKASELYVKLKRRAAEEAGIAFAFARFTDGSDMGTILAKIDEWNADPQIDAIIVQLPLPRRLDERVIVDRTDPEKDVDGFHSVNTARYLSGERSDPPGLVEGILRLIGSTGLALKGLRAAIVARQSVFTKCLAHALSREGAAAVTAAPDGSHHNATIQSDVIVVAAGRPGLITGNDCKPGCAVVDVGINTLPNGKIVGDIDASSVQPVARWLTPVPGGVGPMTIAMLLENTVRLAEKNQR